MNEGHITVDLYISLGMQKSNLQDRLNWIMNGN
jgi:hypothetical protein